MEAEYSFCVSYHALDRYQEKVFNDTKRRERNYSEISDIVVSSIMKHKNLKRDLERNFISGVKIINPKTNEKYGLFNICIDEMLKEDSDFIVSTIFPVERNCEKMILVKGHPPTRRDRRVRYLIEKEQCFKRMLG